MLISALVAEDHDLTRRGIRSLLEDRLEVRVPATTGDGLEVLPLLNEHEPDVLILDLGSGLSEEILESSRSADGDAGDRYDRLTDREREVLQLTAEGYTSKEIGERLYISHRTVDKHRENIQSNLGLSGTVEMTAYAHRRGIIPPTRHYSVSPHPGGRPFRRLRGK
jgi:DNA-binding NarL/FixJ family response regulator